MPGRPEFNKHHVVTLFEEPYQVSSGWKQWLLRKSDKKYWSHRDRQTEGLTEVNQYIPLFFNVRV